MVLIEDDGILLPNPFRVVMVVDAEGRIVARAEGGSRVRITGAPASCAAIALERCLALVPDSARLMPGPMLPEADDVGGSWTEVIVPGEDRGLAARPLAAWEVAREVLPDPALWPAAAGLALTPLAAAAPHPAVALLTFCAESAAGAVRRPSVTSCRSCTPPAPSSRSQA